MRTFKVVPVEAGQEHGQRWQLTATEEDGSQVTLETYSSMVEAQAAMTALERQEMQDPA